MILWHGAVGLMAGALAAVMCFMAGLPVWYAVGAYFVVAAVATTVSAVMSVARERSASTAAKHDDCGDARRERA
jgi:membrane protein implicated in regulation of membrane protease activity